MYAKMTDSQRDAVITSWTNAMYHATDPLHAAAIAARDVLVKSDRAWNGKQGADAFAAVVTTLVFRRILTVALAEGVNPLRLTPKAIEATAMGGTA